MKKRTPKSIVDMGLVGGGYLWHFITEKGTRITACGRIINHNDRHPEAPPYFDPEWCCKSCQRITGAN